MRSGDGDDPAVELVDVVGQPGVEGGMVGGADHALVGELAAQDQPVEALSQRRGRARSRSRTSDSASPSQARICLSTSWRASALA